MIETRLSETDTRVRPELLDVGFSAACRYDSAARALLVPEGRSEGRHIMAGSRFVSDGDVSLAP